MSSTEADYGMIVSLLGTDALSTSDQQQLWNSTWPLLKMQGAPVDFEWPENQDEFSEQAVIKPHGLSYPPLIIQSRRLNTHEDPFYNQVSNVSFDDKSIEILYPFSENRPSTRCFIYRLNLRENYDSPIKTTTFRTPAPFDDDYGIKVLKSTADNIDSTDLRDFAIHSGARSPLVHMVRYSELLPINGGSGGYGASVSHGLPYAPMFFIFLENINPALTGDQDILPWTQIQSGGGGGVTVATATPTTISIKSSVNAFKVSFVVLKDPFNVQDGYNLDVVI